MKRIEEELIVRIRVVARLEPVDFDYGIKQICLIPFVCKIVSGEIRLTEHIARRWVGFDQWKDIDWSGADRKLILKNQESLIYQVRENQSESNKYCGPAQDG